MAGRIKNLTRGRAKPAGKDAKAMGNFNPTQLGHPSALSKGAKARMALGIPQRQAVAEADRGGTNAKVTSKNWSQPGKGS